MRPTTSIMLQQNNNNNYPCLNMSGSAADVLQKCSRASLPFPSRMELGLGDLPLIRGLRAWTLCSKNRLKAGGLLKGGQPPTAPPAGHKGSQSSCHRPADVYLSGEWGHMAYGLPAEADRKAGIKALVTVATLKTSEGSGKTQTHCLFLQTEKGSCLYSTAKPVAVASSSTTSSLVGEWLKGKAGVRGNSRDGPASRKEQGTATQSGAGCVRVRSGRRWRKSSNPTGRDVQRIGGRGEMTLDERQEERNKDVSDRKQPHSPGQDIRRARSEKQAAFRAPRCCQCASHKTCAQCGRGGSPGVATRPSAEAEETRERSGDEQEEKEQGGLALNSDFEHRNHLQSLHSSDIGEIREAAGGDERNQPSQNKGDYSEKEEDGESEREKTHTGHYSQRVPPGQDGDGRFMLRPAGRDSDDQMQQEAPCEETAAHVNGLTDVAEEFNEEKGGNKRLTVESGGCEESSLPAGGSTCISSCTVCAAPAGQESLEDPSSTSSLSSSSVCTTSRQESQALHQDKSTWETRGEESGELIPELGVDPGDGDDAGEIMQSRRTCNNGKVDYNGELHTSAEEEKVAENYVPEDKRRLVESSAGSRWEDEDTWGRVGAKGGVSTAGPELDGAPPSPCPALLPANPAPPANLPEARSKRPPCMEEGEEKKQGGKEETAVRESEGAEERRRQEGELGEKPSTVALEGGSREEQQELEEEDEFGVFMQAEGESAWSEESTAPASVPCESAASTGECPLFCSPWHPAPPPTSPLHSVPVMRRRRGRRE